jgi:hypothetical protein
MNSGKTCGDVGDTGVDQAGVQHRGGGGVQVLQHRLLSTRRNAHLKRTCIIRRINSLGILIKYLDQSLEESHHDRTAQDAPVLADGLLSLQPKNTQVALTFLVEFFIFALFDMLIKKSYIKPKYITGLRIRICSIFLEAGCGSGLKFKFRSF